MGRKYIPPHKRKMMEKKKKEEEAAAKKLGEAESKPKKQQLNPSIHIFFYFNAKLDFLRKKAFVFIMEGRDANF